MPRATRYACEINGECFATAKSLAARCRVIIDKYLYPHCPLDAEMTEDDAAFFVELVRLRDSARIPCGSYVRKVFRSHREGQIGRHVRFLYGNGEADMIGWSKLCGGRPCDLATVSGALRETVRQQCQLAYARFFDGGPYAVCPKSGLTIGVTAEMCDDAAVVHHDGLQFDELRDGWLASQAITILDIPIKDLWDGGCEVAPGRLADSWKAWHHEHARLIVVSSRWHLEHHADKRKGTDSNGETIKESTAAA